MWNAVRSAIDVGLQGQATRLMNLAQGYVTNLAEDFKDRTIEEARTQAVAVGITAAIVMFGLFFVAIAVSIGLVALYFAVAPLHGPFIGFAASGGTAALIAAVMFTIVAIRASNNTPKPKAARANLNAVKSQANDAWQKTAVAAATRGTIEPAEALALGKQTVDAATGIVRNGSREAVLATLAATVIVGLLIGRRR